MSTSFAFQQRLHLYSVSNLRICLVFHLWPFKVGFSGTKTFRDVRETGPWPEKRPIHWLLIYIPLHTDKPSYWVNMLSTLSVVTTNENSNNSNFLIGRFVSRDSTLRQNLLDVIIVV